MLGQVRDFVEKQFGRSLRFTASRVDEIGEDGSYTLSAPGRETEQTGVQKASREKLRNGDRAAVLGSSANDMGFVLGTFPYLV